MKQRRLKKRGLSLLLAFSMVISLFTGQIIVKSEAQAADAEIILNSLEKGRDGTYYTYPNATVNYSDSTKKFHTLTVSVDSGHLKVSSTKINGVTGNGIISGNDMNVDFTPLTTTDKYEAISFELSEGATKDEIQDFIRTIHFTTANRNQSVSIYVTTKNNAELKTTVGGRSVDLYYFNGHYYGYVRMENSSITWTDAFNESKTADFCGAKGYLATLTTRAEDRFILSSFKEYGNYAKKGWMGCTRAKLADGSKYTDPDTKWQPLDKFDYNTNQEDFVWRWAAGPEAGTAFGYQSRAFGDGTSGDGGFVTYQGSFSNWGNDNYHSEPNGGGSLDEGYAYYGEYEYGRWNDYPDNGNMYGYYIEFGGYEGDDEKFKENLSQTIISTTEVTNEIITDGSYGGTSTEPDKNPISGKVVIKNETTDDNGNAIKKEGTVLSADITGVTPSGSHDTLSYQWYVKNNGTLTPIDGAVDKNFVLTTDTVDKELVVKVTGTGNYTGDVQSEPYDTTRTNSGIELSGNDDTNLPADKRTITIFPTVEDTIYAIKDENGNVYGAGELSALPAVDGAGNSLTPNVTDAAYPGYYQVEPGGKIVFTVDKDKNYIIHEVKKTTTNTEVISPTIPDSNIKTTYDNKNTEDTADDTISIIIEPAQTNYKYAVLKKEDGKYVEVPVTKDANGNYAASSSGTDTWSNGGETKVTFSGLPANGTYRVVSVSTSDTADTSIKDLTPDKVIGGSKEITVTPAADPEPTVTPATPVNNGQTSSSGTTVFTEEETNTAAKFVKEHATGPNGKVITKVTDITRDIITSGETEWNKLTEREKEAVNAKLKESGCPYTYKQLLNKAKKYKIPGFKLKKVMQKKTKAKLKLIKCKGATIVCTSTNKKVASVNKKGIISAKKVGTATLTFTAVKGKYTNRLVVKIVVRKKFKNAKELNKFKSKEIKTPTVLIAKKRLLKKSTKIRIYDLKKNSKVQFTAFNKKVLKLTNQGKYTGKKKGSSLVRAKVNQNNKVYLLYVYVTIF